MSMSILLVCATDSNYEKKQQVIKLDNNTDF